MQFWAQSKIDVDVDSCSERKTHRAAANKNNISEKNKIESFDVLRSFQLKAKNKITNASTFAEKKWIFSLYKPAKYCSKLRKSGWYVFNR